LTRCSAHAILALLAHLQSGPVTSQAAVIIANWNGRHLLPGCLRALEHQTFRNFEIVIVDNGSRDGSVEWLATHAPHVRIIRNADNLGFAAANNQGIRATTVPLIVTLNNDAVPDPDWLESLVAAADRSEQVGMFASRVVLRQPAGRMDSAGIEVDRAGVAWNRLWGEPESDVGPEPIEVFGPSAAAALYRRSMLDQIGLFDEALFAYYEDVDLAWRARWAGWRCLYISSARVQHIHSATGGQDSPYKRWLLGRNKWWVIAKNYPFRVMWHYVPVMWLVDLAAMLIGIVAGRSLSPVRGRWAALRAWRSWWRRRNDVQQHQAEAIDWYALLRPIRLPRRSPRKVELGSV